jgi:hypothetical protein
VAWPTQSPDLNTLYFFPWGCMKSRVYHDGKPQTRHQSVEATDEAAINIRNEMGCMQWQHLMA